MRLRTILYFFLIINTHIILTGCASITTGQTQTISVQTPNCVGAQCTLTNDEGTYFVSSTPGSVVINKSGSQLSVTCSKEGDVSRATSASSQTDNLIWGNILFGGVIGAAVDMNTGAAYEYPNLITHPLQCNSDQVNSSPKKGGLILKGSDLVNKVPEKDKIEELEKELEQLKKIKSLEKQIEQLKNENNPNQ